MKKMGIRQGLTPIMIESPGLFAGVDSVVGANLSARTAVDASLRIDNIDVAFADALGGANG